VKILVVGMSHHSAPVEVRERFAVSDPRSALHKLVASDAIEEAVILSTCNRVEIVATSHQPEAARHHLNSFFERDLAEQAGLADSHGLSDYLYHHADADAVSHVFRVASAIDSMVVGEPQILGQVKDAYREAVEDGTSGPVLSRLFQRAFATAKRVKNETRIAERPVSVARVAVELSEQVFESLANKRGLLIGAGEMIETALQALHRDGLQDIAIANRTVEHAEELAKRFGATWHGLGEIDDLLARSDVVLTCIGGDSPLLDRPRIERALRSRRNRPVFVIDIGVPRNVHPDVNQLDSVYLYNIDDLQEISAANAQERRGETVRAEQIVVEEQRRFEGWLVALQAVPTIRHLRGRAESIRSSEIDRVAGKLGFDEEQRDGVEALTRAIVNKILHPPLARLRAESDREEGIAILEAARSLFGLDEQGGETAASSPASRPRELGDDDEDSSEASG
jgi:glutamyl-tRNA reductase